MGLTAPQMADRIDAKGRIEYGEGAADAGEQETPQAADPTIMEEANHKRESES